MGATILKGQPVDERLECRAGRADRTRHIDIALPSGLEQAAGAHAGQDLAAPVIGDQDRHRDPLTERRGPRVRELLEPFLQAGIQSEAMDCALGMRAPQPIGQMRRQNRRIQACGRDGLGTGRGGLVRVDDPGQTHMLEHAIARPTGGLGEPVRPACLGRLGQSDEQRRLGRRQASRLLAEPRERGRAQAFEVAAVGGEGQIGLEDGVFVETSLQPECGADLAELAARVPCRARLQQPCQLHSEGRAARTDTSRAQQLPAGAHEGERIDTRMGLESAILVGQEHRHIGRIDRIQIDRQTPASVGNREGAQQTPVAVQHEGRGGDTHVERRRGINESIQPGSTARQQEQNGADGRKRLDQCAIHREHQGHVTAEPPPSAVRRAVASRDPDL